MRISLGFLFCSFLCACGTSQLAPATPASELTHFRSQANHLEADLPAGWAAGENGGFLARPFVGLVAFNSWGQEEFWARQVEAKTTSGVSYTYSPETVLRQIPTDEAYIVLTDVAGGPQMQADDYGPEHTRQDLESLWAGADCRGFNPFSVNFYKWGRLLRLEVYCGADASEDTAEEVNDLLESWRFDRVPAGDVGWATLAARELLPAEINPRAFPILSGGPTESHAQQRDIVRKTRAEVMTGDVVAVTFSLRWEAPESEPKSGDCPPQSCHWWRYEARPDGEVLLVEEGGAALPIE